MKFIPITKYKVCGNSMLPTLRPGQEILAFCWWRILGVKVGDLVVVRREKDIIKRIKEIKGGKLFVVGDNQRGSTDSRQFGFIDQNKICGKVILINE